MDNQQDQHIAAQALKALALRRRLEQGEITQQEYLEFLDALQRVPAPPNPPSPRPPSKPAREAATGESRLMGAFEALQLGRRPDKGEPPPQEYRAQIHAQPAPAPLPKPHSTPALVPPALPDALPVIVRSDAVLERYLAMKCPGCAGDIHVGDRARELQCNDCGAELVVDRKDCTITLRLAGSSLNETAATAPSAPPANIGEELRKLKAEAAMVVNVKRTSGILGGLCGLTFAYMGIDDMRAQHLAMGVTILVCGSALLGTVICITRHTIKAHAALTARIRAIMASEEAAR